MTLFEELSRRGLIAQMTNPEKIKEKLDNEKTTFYIGFDATADSLHVGHFLQLIVMKHMQNAGHKPMALLGTGTTLIGDPSGKTDMRKMLTPEIIAYNAERFRMQMSKFIDFSDGKAEIVKNGDWLCTINYIDMLREVGVHFTVNRMMAADCFKSRFELDRGLSFLEFNYMIMQSYDFLHLFRTKNCTLELGGDDQWSNIIAGMDLVRRVTGEEVCGMTFTLLTTKEGKKMGKTESGALWLDPEKTSPYEFYQYWRNVSDDDVINCLKLLTFIPIEEIEEMEKWEGSKLNEAKQLLAYELTKLVHSEEDAKKSMETAKALFGGGTHSDDMPTTALSESDFTDGGVLVTDVLVKVGIAPSKGEAKRLITQGGITVNDQKVEQFDSKIAKTQFKDGFVIVKKGKKIFHKITL